MNNQISGQSQKSPFFYRKLPIILGAIMIIIIAGGILAWQYFWVPEEEVKAPKEIVEDETVDWKTYRNENYGYEVKYPSSWRIAPSLEAHWCGSPWWGCGVKEAGFENVVFTNLSSEEEKKYLDEINTYEGIGTGECHIENADGRSIRIIGVTCPVEEILQKKEVGWDIIKLREEETKTGLKLTRVRETISWEQYRDHEVVYIPYPNNKDGKIKYIALIIERNDENYEIEIFNQMLSTFQFLE